MSDSQINNTVTWLSQEECLQRGGHHWNNYDSHHPHDEYGRMDHSVGYAVGGEPNYYRKCGLCGKNQRKVPAYWEDTK